ncbi:MAG: DMT family transporter, partial [Treponemataceae bacterium]
MTVIDSLLFILLAAIWGSSFIFMRSLAPILGPVVTALVRTLVAGIFLTALFSTLRTKMDWRKNFRHYLIVGLLNSGIPFVLYSFAATRLPTSIPAIVNALTPLWGAVFSALILADPLTPRKLVGLALGVSGVALIALRGSGLSVPPDPIAVVACVAATVCYGIAGSYIKRWASSVPSRSITAASLTFAGICLIPFALAFPPPATQIPLSVWSIAAAFSLLCSALAYL